MNIQVEATISGRKKYISPDGFSDSLRFWEPAVGPEIIAPSLTIPTVYGGYQALSMGAISIVNSVFRSMKSWPPPTMLNDITVRYTDSNDVLQHMFTAIGYLSKITTEACVYDLYPESTAGTLLESGIGIDGNSVDLPIVVGKAYYFNATALELSIDGDPQYHNGDMSGNLAKGITGFYDGSGFTIEGIDEDWSGVSWEGLPDIGLIVYCQNDFTASETISIEDADNIYNGDYTITGSTVDYFTIAETYAGQTTGHAYRAGDWRVYDDGVPISGNASQLVPGATFQLSDNPVGAICVSGTGQMGSTLSDVIEHLTYLLKIEYGFNSNHARNTLPEISYYVTSQTRIIDLIDLICKSVSHMYFIKDNIAWLVDMDLYIDTITVPYLVDISASMPQPVYSSTITANRNTVVIDGTDIVFKEDNAELKQSSQYPFGDDISIEGVQRTDIELIESVSRLTNLINKTQFEFTVPINSIITFPCYRYYIYDPVNNLSCYVIARNISYNFDNLTATISGDGLFEGTSMVWENWQLILEDWEMTFDD